MDPRDKKNLFIAGGIAVALFIMQLFLQGALYINSFYTFVRVMGDSLLVVTLIMFGMFVLAMAWYNGLFDAITYMKDGAGKLHVENGQVKQKQTITQYSETKKKERRKPMHLLKVWLVTLVPAVIFSVLAVILSP